jgi:Rps23 Pro-64 3,4-dihydroxylase Tpa1-like proline 4-hydroxylase
LATEAASEYPAYSPETGYDAAVGRGKSLMNAQYGKMEIQKFNLGPAQKFVIAHLQSSIFRALLTEITGISHLIPDPYLFGGGPHQILPGGHLSLHLDYNFNEQIQMWRRVNVFVGWGGELELWNADMTQPETKIAPLFNRLVIFTTSEVSWHGHPNPLQCPPDRSRKSIALYYYTAHDEEGATKEPRQTDFRPREGIDEFTAAS